ncbi:MAG TPA: HAMP domain-containing sensor histidine kinase [Myxococcaceae bacterium]
MPPEVSILPSRLTYRLLVLGVVTVVDLVLFWKLQPRGLASVRPILVFQVILAGLLFGWRGGLLAGIVTVPLATWIVWMAGNWNAVTGVGLATGALSLAMVGSAVGGVTDLSRRLRQEIVHRKRMQDELLASQRRHLEASMEAQFLRASRMASLGTLTEGVAHELRNPLAYLTSNLETVRTALSGPRPPRPEEMKGVHDALKESIEGAERIETIVKAIRVFSPRPSEEAEELVDVRTVVATALEGVRGLLRTRAVLSSRFEGEPTVRGNTGRLGQVLIHLLVNAAEAIPEGRPERNVVTVTSRTYLERVLIEVSDTGAGIRPDILQQIFEPFFTTKPSHTGTGLGLFVSKGIVTGLGGSLTVRTEPGKGSTFTIDLPSARR